jgi:hypothetical protein
VGRTPVAASIEFPAFWISASIAAALSVSSRA